MLHLGDITKINGATAPVVDCIIGGSPCQDLSIAGKRAGLAGERSGLYMDQIRIIKEMRANDRANGRTGEFIRPRYMVWENVPGAFSSNKGKDFTAVLEEAIRVVEPEAPDVPVPEKGWPTAGVVMGDGWSVAWRVFDAQFWGVPQRRRRIALVADFGGQSAPEIVFVRKSVLGDTGSDCSAKEKTAGRTESVVGAAGDGGMADRVIGIDFYNQAITGDKAKPLTAAATDSDHVPCILDISHRSDGVRVSGEICPSLCARAGTDGNNVPLVYRCTDVGFFNSETEKSPTLLARTYKDPHIVSAANKRVRRLTPLECERLQGFPDFWTDIGTWVDSKGKKHESSDAARYKALGNSIALPPWKWVLKRLCAQYERDATMASLFDGIGGFPLIWEQLNGKGSCLWASEIEEFPIAVTKLRFSPTVEKG